MKCSFFFIFYYRTSWQYFQDPSKALNSVQISSLPSLPSVKILFYYVLGILEDKLPQPGEGTVVPALGVDGEHDLIGQPALLHGADDAGGGV